MSTACLLNAFVRSKRTRSRKFGQRWLSPKLSETLSFESGSSHPRHRHAGHGASSARRPQGRSTRTDRGTEPDHPYPTARGSRYPGCLRSAAFAARVTGRQNAGAAILHYRRVATGQRSRSLLSSYHLRTCRKFARCASHQAVWGTRVISTRRLSCRPSAELLSATGRSSPIPTVIRRASRILRDLK
jgi:hypothetical protein